jgi:hypothetical protein
MTLPYDLSVLGNILEVNKETCGGALNVADTLEEAAHLIAKAYFLKWLEVWVFHESHLLHFLARNWVYYCVSKMEICQMIGAQRNFFLGSFYVP